MTKDEQIIKAALEDGNLSYSQAAAYRLLLRCAKRISAMENLEKEDASGGRIAATPSPDQQIAALTKERDEARRTRDVAHAECNRLLEEKRRLESQLADYRADAVGQMRKKLTQTGMVRQFNRKFGVPIAATPAFPERDRMDLRVRLIAEEFTEFLEACGYSYSVTINGVFLDVSAACRPLNLVAAADGLADLQYVTEGTALEFGIPLADVFAEVHRSNMTKTGQPDAGGKITKGEGYEPPQIERVLREHGWEG